MVDTLGDALPREMTRVRKLTQMYASIGPAGIFAVTLMNDALDRAQKAIIEGDMVAMIKVYQELQGFTE